MRLSVIVTIVEGGEALVTCLEALEAQGIDFEVLVPFDSTTSEMRSLSRRFERFSFIDMGDVPTEGPVASPRGQHELFDRRRARGLAEATGDIIAILEDRGVPTPGWARTVLRLHTELPHAVIGGAVENAVDRLANWAVYFCDFTRYQRPFEPGPADYVTDVNVSYKRRALEATRSLWSERYHETTVHWALLHDGETLFLTPELVVEQRRTRTSPMDLLSERLHWGRLFAYTRADANLPLRLAYLGASPLIAPLMFLRQARQQWEKRIHFRRFAITAPAVAGLLVTWAAGEAVGYLTGRP